MNDLATQILGALKSIDYEQKEGGIYALPDRYSKGKWPAPHHHIFGGTYEDLSLLARLGLSGKEEKWGKRIEFNAEEKAASLQFLDIAYTKVRAYGNRYQLDKHHGKKWEDFSAELRNVACKLSKELRWNYDVAFLVALIFTDSQKHAEDTIGPSIEQDFLYRYGLTHVSDTWEDPHGRGIWTTVL